MAIEETMERLIAALTRTADNQERLLAGQSAAIEKIDEAATGRKRRTKAEIAADEAAAAAAAGNTPEPEKPETAPEPEKTAPVDTGTGPTTEQLKATALAYIAAQPTQPDKDAASVKLSTLLPFFGATNGKLTGPESTLTAHQRKQASFFIKRWNKDLPVVLDAPYDFDGDWKQDQPGTAAAAAFDPLG